MEMHRTGMMFVPSSDTTIRVLPVHTVCCPCNITHKNNCKQHTKGPCVPLPTAAIHPRPRPRAIIHEVNKQQGKTRMRIRRAVRVD